MGQLAEKKEEDKTERLTGLGRKTKTGDSKVESNDSPEIPDRGKTPDIPGLPSGAGQWPRLKLHTVYNDISRNCTSKSSA